VTVRTLLPLLNHQRDLDEAPGRVLRALDYLSFIDLAQVVRRAQWPSAPIPT
jgi:hypothetical protein